MVSEYYRRYTRPICSDTVTMRPTVIGKSSSSATSSVVADTISESRTRQQKPIGSFIWGSYTIFWLENAKCLWNIVLFNVFEISLAQLTVSHHFFCCPQLHNNPLFGFIVNVLDWPCHCFCHQLRSRPAASHIHSFKYIIRDLVLFPVVVRETIDS